MSAEQRPTYGGVFLQIAIGVVLSPLLMGIPILATALGELIALASSDVARSARRRGTREAGGFIALACLAAASVFGGLAGLGLGNTADHLRLGGSAGALVVVLLAPFLSALAFAPLALMPLVALERRSLDTVPAEAMRRWALAPLRSVLATTALLAGHAALPFLVGVGVAWWDDDWIVAGLLVGLLLTLVSSPFTLRRLARMNLDARAVAPGSQRALLELRGIARAPLATLPALLTLLIAFVAWPAELQQVARPAAQSGPSTLTVAEGVELEADYDGIRVRRGGLDVGHRSGGFDFNPFLLIEPIEFRGQPARLVTLSSQSSETRAWSLVIDEDGNRLDASVLDSLDQIPTTAFALLALAAIFGVALMAIHGRMVAYLRVVAAAQAGDAADVIRGRLRAPQRAHLSKGRLLAGEGAALVSDDGAITIALPAEGAQVIAAELAALAHEQPRLTLLSRDARIGSGGLREASAPFPPGGQLVVGDPDAALSALVSTSHGGMMPWLAIATCLALTAACAAMSVGLMAL